MYQADIQVRVSIFRSMSKNCKKYFTFGGVLSSEGVFCLLRINRGMALSESSDSSLGINSKNLLSGLQMIKNNTMIFETANTKNSLCYVHNVH